MRWLLFGHTVLIPYVVINRKLNQTKEKNGCNEQESCLCQAVKYFKCCFIKHFFSSYGMDVVNA